MELLWNEDGYMVGYVPEIPRTMRLPHESKRATDYHREHGFTARGSASEGASVSKSKRKSLEDLFEQYKNEFRENQQKRKEDSSLPKLLSPLQHQYCRRKGFEEAA